MLVLVVVGKPSHKIKNYLVFQVKLNLHPGYLLLIPVVVCLTRLARVYSLWGGYSVHSVKEHCY